MPILQTKPKSRMENISNAISPKIRKKSLMMINENDFLLKAIIHEKVQKRKSEPNNLFNPLISLFYSSFRYLKHLNLSQIRQKLNIGKVNPIKRNCRKLIMLFWKVVYVLRFMRTLKWRTSMRKLSLITEREIAFVDDMVYFTQVDLIKTTFNCKCLKIPIIEHILSEFFIFSSIFYCFFH